MSLQVRSSPQIHCAASVPPPSAAARAKWAVVHKSSLRGSRGMRDNSTVDNLEVVNESLHENDGAESASVAPARGAGSAGASASAGAPFETHGTVGKGRESEGRDSPTLGTRRVALSATAQAAERAVAAVAASSGGSSPRHEAHDTQARGGSVRAEDVAVSLDGQHAVEGASPNALEKLRRTRATSSQAQSDEQAAAPTLAMMPTGAQRKAGDSDAGGEVRRDGLSALRANAGRAASVSPDEASASALRSMLAGVSGSASSHEGARALALDRAAVPRDVVAQPSALVAELASLIELVQAVDSRVSLLIEAAQEQDEQALQPQRLVSDSECAGGSAS